MDSLPFERIDEISLEDTLPEVFLQESIPPSDVWRKRIKLKRGGRYLIEAASGTGKSSLCAYLYGSRRDYDGVIRFGNCDAREFTIAQWQQLRRRHIAYLPQELSLFPELTAMENIQLKSRLTDTVTDAEIEQWLHELGIDSRAHYPVGRMSIGQQQRVAIIRCVCQPMDFILLDEPVSHLDGTNNRIAAGIIGRVAEKYGAGVISTSVGNPLLLPDSNLLRL